MSATTVSVVQTLLLVILLFVISNLAVQRPALGDLY